MCAGAESAALRRLREVEGIQHMAGGRIPRGESVKRIPALDELEHRRMFVESVADVFTLGVRGNDQQRYARTQPLLIDLWWSDMIVETPKSS